MVFLVAAFRRERWWIMRKWVLALIVAVSVAGASVDVAQAQSYAMPTELAPDTVIGGLVDAIKGYITAGLVVTAGFFGLSVLVSSTKRKAAAPIRA